MYHDMRASLAPFKSGLNDSNWIRKITCFPNGDCVRFGCERTSLSFRNAWECIFKKIWVCIRNKAIACWWLSYRISHDMTLIGLSSSRHFVSVGNSHRSYSHYDSLYIYTYIYSLFSSIFSYLYEYLERH